MDPLPADHAGRSRCHCCGAALDPAVESVIKRGAVVVAFDPVMVTWRGIHVPLSPTEAHVYAYICRRGRVSVQEIDQVLEGLGCNPTTRSLVMGHIRGKFRKLGACDPFERLGSYAVRLRVDVDENGSGAPTIGARLPRYVRVSQPA